MRKPPPRVHYVPDPETGRAVCGRKAGLALPVTMEPGRVTCSACKNSPLLDNVFGNMSHTGHA